MQLRDANIPRIDYEYYSDAVKLLIEKESTNLNVYSGSYINGSGAFAAVYGGDRANCSLVDNSKLGKAISYLGSATLRIETVSFAAQPEKLIFSFWCYSPSDLGTTQGIRSYFRSDGNMVFNRKSQLSRYVHPYIPQTTITGYTHHLYTNSAQAEPALFGAWQLEVQDEATSFIPTTNAAATRAADVLSYELPVDGSVYLKTTKQNVVLDKTAGIWNIDQDLSNEGILYLAVFDRILTDAEKASLTV
ncbi:MAG: hypothetical protein ACK5M3_15970 [Dysgonomonas sp.]